MKHPLIVYVIACIWFWSTTVPLRGVPLWVLLSGESSSAEEVPQTIDNLAVWLRADSLSGYSDGATLEVWEDESANNYAFRSSGTNRPTYQTNEANGLPVIRFDGTNDYLWEEAPSPQFRMPNDETCTGVAFDDTDNTLWIADYDTGNLVHMTRVGDLIATVDTPIGANSIQGVAYDTSDDTLWIADRANSKFYNVTKAGAEVTSFTVAYTISGIAYDASDDSLWTVEDGADTVRKYSASTRTFTSSITVGALTQADQITLDENGHLLISDDGFAGGESTIFRVNKTTASMLNTYSYTNTLKSIEGVALDTTNNSWWVANDDLFHESYAQGNRIFNLNGDGTFKGELRNASGATVFVVRKCTVNPTTTKVIFQISVGTSAITRASVLAGATSGKPSLGGRRLDADSGQVVTSATSVSTSAFEIHAAHIDYANSDAYLFIDGTQEGSSTSFQTSGSTSNTATFRMGLGSLDNSIFWNGDIAEVIVYSRYLAAPELAAIHSYLSSKYAITIP